MRQLRFDGFVVLCASLRLEPLSRLVLAPLLGGDAAEVNRLLDTLSRFLALVLEGVNKEEDCSKLLGSWEEEGWSRLPCSWEEEGS